jgi:hypothetical protein
MDKFILEIPNLVPHDLCSKIINRFENDSNKKPAWMDYISNGKKIHRSKRNTELHISYRENWKDLDLQIQNYVYKAVMEYLKFLEDGFKCEQEHHTLDRVIYNINQITDSGYCIQKIKTGDHYDWHTDSVPCVPGFIQLIIYLNDFNLDQGGCTEFPSGKKVRPECGKVLIFPCSWTYPHRGNQVKYGTKYICSVEVINR